jgi:hypothetical protein
MPTPVVKSLEERRRIVIYPTFDAFYYSFYLEGIREVFGECNVHFSYEPFPALDSSCFAFILRGTHNWRVLIDAYDGAQISNHVGIRWSDVHGKVNLVSSQVPDKYRAQSVPVGPSFPILVWPRSKAWLVAFRNYRATIHGFKNAREHFANYRRQYRYRLPLNQYVPGQVRANYIFHSSTLWPEVQASSANHYRAQFMEACKSVKELCFEGGFRFNSSAVGDLATKYRGYLETRSFSHPDWLEKTKASVLVFNTPSVWGSHGTKLGEYLALGKAIITTPLSRELPAPLVHGEHLHIIDGSRESFKDAIDQLLHDSRYRNRLEGNARNYFLQFLSPARVIERLVAPEELTSDPCRTNR